jgi:hypothetical protein
MINDKLEKNQDIKKKLEKIKMLNEIILMEVSEIEKSMKYFILKKIN